MTVASQYTFRYPFASGLTTSGSLRTLRLATFREGKDANGWFFEGQLTNPQRAAGLLRAVTQIVKSRFHMPAAMLSRIVAESDPVVTANDDRLRFEGFSACCGVYVRADFLKPSFQGEIKGRGTTNVDFNAPMLSALAKVRRGDQIGLAIGNDQLVLKKESGDVVEKKVRLPIRWMKGFVEVQTVQSRMELVHELSGLHSLKFFRSLPRMQTHRRATFVTSAGSGLRLSQTDSANGVRVGGLERLRVLETIAKDAESLKVFADNATAASGWVLDFGDSRFHLVLSPEVWRGFSGEGQALTSLASVDRTVLPKVKVRLKWQSVVDEVKLARSLKLQAPVIRAVLQTLGTRGNVGYDLSERAYFHREMPFDISQVEKQQPRLLAARKLMESGSVRITRMTPALAEIRVDSSGVEHRVEIRSDESFKCTCPWYNKHQETRGPCKHVLAGQLMLENQAE
ncbi:MAG: SWIM zinc finger family protein [Planctomycetaceae bacterium]|nr:SWIM zinc finger family protein [Planctomycetaceae bacterium]